MNILYLYLYKVKIVRPFSFLSRPVRCLCVPRWKFCFRLFCILTLQIYSCKSMYTFMNIKSPNLWLRRYTRLNVYNIVEPISKRRWFKSQTHCTSPDLNVQVTHRFYTNIINLIQKICSNRYYSHLENYFNMYFE